MIFRGTLAASMAVALTSVSALSAQTAAPTFAKAEMSLPRPVPTGSLWMLLHADSLPRAVPATYWLKGGVIGAVALGVPGAILAHEFCEYDEIERDCAVATIGGALITGATGFALGSLIGGLFPKPQEASTLR